MTGPKIHASSYDIEMAREAIDIALGDEPAPCTSAPDLWFPEPKDSRSEQKRLCKTQCLAKDECLFYALIAGERFGIWGGRQLNGRPLRSDVGSTRV